jgi:nucleotide-binding universal stress UspA family protein
MPDPHLDEGVKEVVMLGTKTRNTRRGSPVVRFKKILVATDFSESSRTALREASLLVKQQRGAQLMIVHVADHQLWMFAPPNSMEAIREQVWDAAAKSMDEWRRSAYMPKQAKFTLCEGDIPTEINKLVHKWKPDLLIIGTHGRQGLQQIMVGSIAQEILRTVECPVMTIGPAVALAEASEQGSIVLAMDFSSAAKKAAAYAVALAKSLGLRLVVFRAMEGVPKRLEEALLRRLKAAFEKRFSIRGMKVEYKIAFTELSAGLMEAAMQSGARFIVMGAKRGGAFLRTTTHWPKAMTYRVICGGAAPVITVRQ